MVIVVCLCLINETLGAQSMKNHWKHYIIEDKELGVVNFHVFDHSMDEEKPLLLFLEGSGSNPIFLKHGNGNLSTGITLNFDKYGPDYHIAVVSKPGIPFEATAHYDQLNRPYYPRSEDFRSRYSFDWRVKSSARVINELISKLSVDTDKIVVMGHSEGSQVAPAVALNNENVTHVVSLMGNALNHYYDFIVANRIAAANGELAPEEAQRRIDSLFNQYETIQSKSSEEEWYGDTYLKWGSFTERTPLDEMLQLEIPILYVGGGRDRNQPLYGMDYAKLEFLRRGKNNLTYKVYPNQDHFFQEYIISGEEHRIEDRINEVHDFAIEWVNSSN